MTLFLKKISYESMPPKVAKPAVVLSLYKNRTPAPPLPPPPLHSKCAVTIINFIYLKRTKSDQNIHQNTSNCIILIIQFFGVCAPLSPLYNLACSCNHGRLQKNCRGLVQPRKAKSPQMMKRAGKGNHKFIYKKW